MRLLALGGSRIINPEDGTTRFVGGVDAGGSSTLHEPVARRVAALARRSGSVDDRRQTGVHTVRSSDHPGRGQAEVTSNGRGTMCYRLVARTGIGSFPATSMRGRQRGSRRQANGTGLKQEYCPVALTLMCEAAGPPQGKQHRILDACEARRP